MLISLLQYANQHWSPFCVMYPAILKSLIFWVRIWHFCMSYASYVWHFWLLVPRYFKKLDFLGTNLAFLYVTSKLWVTFLTARTPLFKKTWFSGYAISNIEVNVCNILYVSKAEIPQYIKFLYFWGTFA